MSDFLIYREIMELFDNYQKILHFENYKGSIQKLVNPQAKCWMPSL